MARHIDGIRAVTFDLDGTLVDTAPDLAAALNLTLVMLGGAGLPEKRVPALIGGGIDQFVGRALAQSLGGRVARPALQAAGASLFRELYGQRLFERSRLYPGVRSTLRALARSGIRLGCVTNKESRFTAPLLEAAQLEQFFTLTLCAEHAGDRKPAPNLLIAASERLGIEPHQLLHVGDSRSDVLAAQAAGCRVAAAAYGYGRDSTLTESRPDAIVGAVAEILALCLSPAGRAHTLRAVL